MPDHVDTAGGFRPPPISAYYVLLERGVTLKSDCHRLDALVQCRRLCEWEGNGSQRHDSSASMIAVAECVAMRSKAQIAGRSRILGIDGAGIPRVPLTCTGHDRTRSGSLGRGEEWLTNARWRGLCSAPESRAVQREFFYSAPDLP